MLSETLLLQTYADIGTAIVYNPYIALSHTLSFEEIEDDNFTIWKRI